MDGVNFSIGRGDVLRDKNGEVEMMENAKGFF